MRLSFMDELGGGGHRLRGGLFGLKGRSGRGAGEKWECTDVAVRHKLQGALST